MISDSGEVRMENQFRKARKGKLTQAQLSDAVGMNIQQYQRIENGNMDDLLNKIDKIADELGVSIDFLLGRSNEMLDEIITTVSQLPPEFQRYAAECLKSLKELSDNTK